MNAVTSHARAQDSVHHLRERALAEERGGDRHAALATIDAACRAAPGDAMLANTAGNIALRAGDAALAERRFAAAAAGGGTLDYSLNHAIALAKLDRHDDALAVLDRCEAAGGGDARYCSVRATSLRATGRVAAAARWYDRCLGIKPGQPKALHGRARVALERGEPDALARFDAALSASPGDGDLWLGKAQALDVAGDAGGARTIAEQLARKAPRWLDALAFLAQLRSDAGEADFASHYVAAARSAPDDPAVPSAHAALLASCDRHAEAADVAADAAGRFPEIAHFRVLEAAEAGAAGQLERAETLFAALTEDSEERHLQEARHRLRTGEHARVQRSLDALRRHNPWSVGGWALQGLLWRLTGDARTEWLYLPERAARRLALDEAAPDIARLSDALHALHAASPFPLGQSLRGGTQTRGLLFDRHEPIFGELADAVRRTVERYREALPPADPDHPLLRHRNADWRIAGSWSVRLTGGGDHHAAHIHPGGIVSSALYIALSAAPEPDRQAGWLELGRPPPELRLDLEPLLTIEPEPGHLALFPSYLYHGTRAFAGAERMSVAFDVAAADMG